MSYLRNIAVAVMLMNAIGYAQSEIIQCNRKYVQHNKISHTSSLYFNSSWNFCSHFSSIIFCFLVFSPVFRVGLSAPRFLLFFWVTVMACSYHIYDVCPGRGSMLERRRLQETARYLGCSRLTIGWLGKGGNYSDRMRVVRVAAMHGWVEGSSVTVEAMAVMQLLLWLSI
jgi:hypothetical protein